MASLVDLIMANPGCMPSVKRQQADKDTTARISILAWLPTHCNATCRFVLSPTEQELDLLASAADAGPCADLCIPHGHRLYSTHDAYPALRF